MKLKHNNKGNCWDKSYKCRLCGTDNLCDICHLHDLPRGECSECDICKICNDDFSEVG